MSTGTSAWTPQTGGVPPQPVPPQNVPPYGWTPPPTGSAPGPLPQGAPRPPKMWLWALVISILMVVAIAATAAITYAITHSASTSAVALPAPSEPTFTAAQTTDATQALCHTFDVSTAGGQGQGGVRVDGQPNLPVLIRTLSSTVAIQDAIVPATPEDLAVLAQKVVSTNLDLTNAALGLAKIDEVNRLTDASTTAIYALADACGLPH
jgi:hypothetical protein